MSNKPEVVHLEVSIDEQKYVLASLSFNKKKKECSYHFLHSASSPKEHFFCETGKYANRKDHITWHDKSVHTTDNEKTTDEITYQNGPFLPNIPILTPLFVESVYLEKDPSILRKKEQLNQKSSASHVRVLNLKAPKNFSIVVLLVPSEMGSANALFGLQFLDTPKGFVRPPLLGDLWDIQNPLIPIRDIWKGWEILIFATSYTRTLLSNPPSEIGLSFRLPDYQNVPAALTDLLLQTQTAQYREALIDILSLRLQELLI